jgi:diguanylate cyclase (GGDEF)-like protein
MKNEVIICVDDEVVILNSLRSELAKNFSDYTIELAESAKEALEIIDELSTDGYEILTVVSDYIMPEMNGDELLIKIHEKYPKIVKIMLTGQANIDGIANAINQANLYRYLSKPWEKDDLIMTIREAIKSYKDKKQIEEHQQVLEQTVISKTKDLRYALEKLKLQIKEKETIQKKLVKIATTDTLTGIYNRRKFFLVAEKDFIITKNAKLDLYIMMMDIDHFKSINDTHGHHVGDLVLKGFVATVQKYISKKDLFARIGGEEFAIMIKDHTHDNVLEVAQKIGEAVAARTMTYKGVKFNITVSIGLSWRLDEDQSIDDVIQRADSCLYQAKENGRDQVIDQEGAKSKELTLTHIRKELR